MPDLELTLPLSPPPIEDIIAARRAKRAAILAKYQVAESGASSQSAPEPTALAPAKPEGNRSVDHVQSAAAASGATYAVSQHVEELSEGECCAVQDGVHCGSSDRPITRRTSDAA
jgi:hypothetical protein